MNFSAALQISLKVFCLISETILLKDESHQRSSLPEEGVVARDRVLTVAMPDRILDHAIKLDINCESFRLNEKRKAGVLSMPAKANRLIKVVC